MQHIVKLIRICFMPLKVFDGVEVCSGTGILSRVLRDGGYRICNLDIIDWDDYFKLHRPQTDGNPLDLLSAGGMALLDKIYVCIYI